MGLPYKCKCKPWSIRLKPATKLPVRANKAPSTTASFIAAISAFLTKATRTSIMSLVRSYKAGSLPRPPKLAVKLLSVKGIKVLSLPDATEQNLMLTMTVKMSPPCEPKSARSQPARLAGTVAFWGEVLVFHEVSKTHDLVITVRSKNEVVGRGTLHLNALLDHDHHSDKSTTAVLPLKPSGEARLVVTLQVPQVLFGSPLETVCKRENNNIPHIIRECCEFIDLHGTESEGIYRVPGSQSVVDDLRAACELEPATFRVCLLTLIIKSKRATSSPFSSPRPGALSLCQLDNGQHINNVASLLKAYLRALPEPVLSHELQGQLIAIVADSERPDDEKVGDLIEALQDLSEPRKQTALLLFRHMLKIMESAERNKMTAENLATVFGPTMVSAPGPRLSLRRPKSNVTLAQLQRPT
ncbi:uncharacterized protein MONBRDRAFT_6484 [Monosiga brevicollis MX1]|uniref:Rho-GAP domain-containing protein n=1 Tax=Monosiga brevicollis TaxID=81824 RepID=A9UU08_MONBE|nr:uncharacterized protein MONBRDRAFT_6484 [Monosiga brevicollis MX1]EDQ91586.1 predicted protein [Monosiga brevicollis MX1]|eukprot:XP_001744008.1 hypothetical protein [Monosiga brevicollis MX1]